MLVTVRPVPLPGSIGGVPVPVPPPVPGSIGGGAGVVEVGGVRRRGSWESGRRRRRGGGGRCGRRFDRGRGGVAEERDAEHGRGDGRGDRRQTEQQKRAAPRRLFVLPFLVAEVHLGARVGHVAVGRRPRCRRLRTRPARSTAQRTQSSSWRRQLRERSVSARWPCQRPGRGTRSAPSAAVSCGCGVVTTGAQRCSESRWVISGMRAPPPTVATAETLAAGTP